MRKRKNYVQFTCRIEEEILEEIKHIALDYDLSINEYINECLKFALENLEIEE